MEIQRLVLGEIGTNCYIVAASSKEALVIDPGGGSEVIEKTLEAGGYDLKFIVLTHGHYDHIGAAGELAKKTGAKICLNDQDAILLARPNVNLSVLFGRSETYDFEVEGLKEGDILEIGDLKFSVIETPGHTPGSISLKGDGVLFVGDLLFAGSVGRTDFPYGSHKVLMESLKKLLLLGDKLRVFPGHGEGTTIGEERRSNPFLQELMI